MKKGNTVILKAKKKEGAVVTAELRSEYGAELFEQFQRENKTEQIVQVAERTVMQVVEKCR